MLTIWTNKIKHSTVGSSFSVTFSVAPNELEYLDKLYDCFSSMNWSSFPITADRKTENSSEKPNNCEPQTEVETMSCAECKHRPIGAEICEEACHYEPQTDWHYDEQDATWYPYKHEDEPQQKSCATCKHALGNWDGESNNCGRCCGADRRFYEPKTEPQTDTEIAKAIVHKMIDDSVIAEDAYPDLRQKMHEAVDEYEPQTERSE